MRRTTLITTIIAIALFGCCLVDVSAGQGGRKLVADDVAALGQLREPFLAVLSRAVSAQEELDWTTLYQSQWPVAIEHESLERFVTVRQQSEQNVVDFRLVRIDTVIPHTSTGLNGQWNVLGCALFKEHGKRRTQEAAIPVYFIEGVWFTGEVGPLIGMDAKAVPPPCRLSEGMRLPRHSSGTEK
jgi:hypothetical protein